MSRRRRQAGFTLVELTVALVAGLIVALGITALSREATRTFHEEVRTSAAEATLRTAIDRIRADLQRASYMSTPNAALDILRIAAPPGNPGIPTAAPAAIRRLAGIRLYQGYSTANSNIPLSGNQPVALNPDVIEIGGNMTCAEQFEIQYVQQVGNCAWLMLSATSPALFRINAVGPTGNPAELNNVFQPDGASQFIVRILDDTGRSQYLPTCPGAGAATGFQGNSPYVAVSVNPPLQILAPANTNGLGGITTTPGGRAWVNPVHIVRWEITNAANEPAQYKNALANQSLGGADAGVDPNKYDLIRSYINLLGNVIPATTEVVAEYAVDLKFAFTVETGAPAAPAMQSFTFEDGTNQKWADDVPTHRAQPQQPELIRSVRVRIATRAAQADRTANIPVSNANTGDSTGTYLYRYCVLPPCDSLPDATLRWTRARTITTEVSLPNQAGNFF
jgi:prepilin-type N-terminal cleavage/methylation domain-containing protein